MEKKYFSIKEVAVYMGIAEKTLYERVSRRMIPFFKVGKSVRFDIVELDKWVKQFKKEALNAELLHSD